MHTLSRIKPARYTSNPTSEPVNFGSLTVVAIAGGLLAASCAFTALLELGQGPLVAFMLFLCTLLFVMYMYLHLYWRLLGEHHKYTLEMDPCELRLTILNRAQRKKETHSLPWQEVKWAEIYPLADSETLLLRSFSKYFELPLWAFTRNDQMSITEFIKQKVFIETVV